MQLTVEIKPGMDEVEIYFDKEGYEALKRYFNSIDMAPGTETDHIHLMTKEWGSGELTSDVFRAGNIIINHLRLTYVIRTEE